MLTLNELVDTLGYTSSSHYRRIDEINEPETAHLFRVATEANIHSVYLFDTSPGDGKNILPPRPVVYIAEAKTEQEANETHRNLWNLNYAPFLIVRLPHQIRIYTGFVYSHNNDTDEHEGLLETFDDVQLSQIVRLLSDFSGNSIDSGNIWASSYGNKLNPDGRVDKHLLKNLQKLGDALKKDLPSNIAHALIGKYVYISYLHDRGILTDSWLIQNEIEPDSIFTSAATVQSLNQVTAALEKRFNGKIFPIQFSDALANGLKDKHVSWVASVFNGGEIFGQAPEAILQLPLLFKVYDFHYIPVETLSAIYEQFIENRKEKGAIYTPEFLADYLLSEVEWAKPLKNGGKLLDPACGSGIFLVLAYRRLIEKEIKRLGRNLSPLELKAILQESIFGVERELDACFVTEFSLILTLLHYINPRDLDKLEFKFPALHDTNIFHADFFDFKSQKTVARFWQRRLLFDWIVGNPPWSSELDSVHDHFVLAWMQALNSKQMYPIGRKRIAEAFSWKVGDLIKEDGVVGLLLPATSLFNISSKKFRISFFTHYEVLRITNFANMKRLFGKGNEGTLPAATVIYRNNSSQLADLPIIHYSPFSINQMSEPENQPWVIAINESEICTVSTEEARQGNSVTWKLALWGTFLDKDVLMRLRSEFPHTLKDICVKHNWAFSRNIELRSADSAEKVEHIPDLIGKKILVAESMRDSLFRFSIPDSVLDDLPEEIQYIRKRGGRSGLNVMYAPHIILSPSGMGYYVYSEKDFLIPPMHTGIAASSEDINFLKSLSLYLNSGICLYYLFFITHEWGIFRQAKLVSKAEFELVQTPDFTEEQINVLAVLYDEIVELESDLVNQLTHPEFNPQQQLNFNESWNFKSEATKLFSLKTDLVEETISNFRRSIRQRIDSILFDIFDFPNDMRTVIEEFVDLRLELDKPTVQKVLRFPTTNELLAYGQQLQTELDEFVDGIFSHHIRITTSKDLIECVVEMVAGSDKVSIAESDISTGGKTKIELLASLSRELREQISQWAYVQRGLRLFNGPRIYIYKSPRRIEWTQTQAILDAHDIIGQVLSVSGNDQDANYALA